MKIKDVANSTALVELNSDEIRILNNAINEVCNGISLEGEFDTRMGCTVEEARSLLAEVNKLGKMPTEFNLIRYPTPHPH
ncbi:MAG TPA: hypothetical protein VNY74_04265 [Edaphobacter sp.]|jgi:hypothetical protein|nr:hypothetical protein [Edaphobacter sp.]